jgi:hypothetical protein
VESAYGFGPNERVMITEQGRYDLFMSELCHCDPRLKGLLVQCSICGTVYGHLSELDRTTERRQTRRRYGFGR